MKYVRITIIMKMEPAAVATITMNTVTSVGMSRNTSTAMTKRAAAAKLILMKGMNMMPAVVKNMSTIITAAVVGKNTITNMVMLNVAADMNIITAIMFRVIRMTAGAKSAIRTKNTVTCAVKALKTAPAVCRTLTA